MPFPLKLKNHWILKIVDMEKLARKKSTNLIEMIISDDYNYALLWLTVLWGFNKEESILRLKLRVIGIVNHKTG